MAATVNLPPHIRRSVAALDAASAPERLVQIGEYGDKYSLAQPAEIDCESRWELCHGICCRLEFPLSQQDLDEGVVEWNPSRPYVRACGPDKRCVHQHSETGACGVYELRPAPCRIFDCRNDERIWIDFEQRLINPEIFESTWPGWVAEESEWPE